MEAKRRLAFSILEFLRECNADGTVKPDDAEGVDGEDRALTRTLPAETERKGEEGAFLSVPRTDAPAPAPFRLSSYFAREQKETLPTRGAAVRLVLRISSRVNSPFLLILSSRRAVALQCLGEAFGVNPDDPEHVAKYSTKPATLLSIFEVFLNAEKKKAPPKVRFDAAIDLYTKAINLNPDNAVYYANRYGTTIVFAFTALAASADVFGGGSLTCCNRAALLSRSSAAAYSQSGNHQKAVDDSLKSSQVDPKYSKAYSRLGYTICAAFGLFFL
ncbi:MAG: hypothetical protein BJ554DRAFT_2633 [Olpidium bornovanus]|uniref:SGTA homodimerisation domain-containing protein n=1 Tax=Olpidium bornovanus TaxID=278681 RepID=A0A8H8DGS8_9FUNG|nr:MAG: hypothetical protein BJ554DRAFT_2633 [Olpidium bornovanus]